MTVSSRSSTENSTVRRASWWRTRLCQVHLVLATCAVATVTTVTPALSQGAWWTLPVVLPPDSSVAIEVIDGLAYQPDIDPDTRMAICRPARLETAAPLPVVFYVHGGPISPQLPVSPERIEQAASYCRLAASRGVAAVVFAHRYGSNSTADTASRDISRAMAFVRDNSATYGLDRDRVCIWAHSGGGWLLAPLLRQRPGYVRCLVLYYSVVDAVALGPDVADITDSIISGFNLTTLLRDGSLDLPVLVVKAGADRSWINASLDTLLRTCAELRRQCESVELEGAPHAFDIFVDSDRSRAVISDTFDWLRVHFVNPVHR